MTKTSLKQERLLHNAPPGAAEHPEGIVTFSFYAPRKHSVNLIGDFNDWDSERDPMQDLGDGNWAAAKELPPGRHEYQFVIDNETVICDPYAREIVVDVDPNTPRALIEIGQRPYKWKHDGRVILEFRDLIIYEAHIADYTSEGTFRGFIRKIDTLKKLGVNCVELLPVNESRDYWGYEPTYMFAVRRGLGTRHDLAEFVDALHANGIAVILDIALAHTAKNHPFNQMYDYDDSPWYGKPLGEANEWGMPSFDYRKKAVNDYAIAALKYWLSEYHIDGFRLDFVKGIGEGVGLGLSHIISSVREFCPRAYIIGEYLPENPKLVNDTGLTSVWRYETKTGILGLILEDGTFKENVRKIDPTDTGYKSKSFMVNYIESHDEPRVMFLLEQRGFFGDTAIRKAKLAATALLTLPGEPMLFSGQEWGETASRRQEPCKLAWSLLDMNKELLEHYRALCALRLSVTSLRSENMQILVADPQNKCLVWFRNDGSGGGAVVALNFSCEEQKFNITFPESGTWCSFFAGKNNHYAGETEITLGALCAEIFLQTER